MTDENIGGVLVELSWLAATARGLSLCLATGAKRQKTNKKNDR
jgi:hypothetical protein